MSQRQISHLAHLGLHKNPQDIVERRSLRKPHHLALLWVELCRAYVQRNWSGCFTDILPAADVGRVYLREKLLSESACCSVRIRGSHLPHPSPHPRLLWVRMSRLGLHSSSLGMGGHTTARFPWHGSAALASKRHPLLPVSQCWSC